MKTRWFAAQDGVLLTGKILVTYDSGYGATSAAAEAVAETLREKGLKVDLRPVGLEDLSTYDALFLGSPIRLGYCTPKIKKFLNKNLTALASMRVAFFFTCMSVTNDENPQKFPLYIEQSLSDPNKPAARLRLMENNHTVSYYLKHFFHSIPGVTPQGIAFFKGSLDTRKLSLTHRLIMWFAMFSLPEIENGDFLNPIAIGTWAENIINRMEEAQQG